MKSLAWYKERGVVVVCERGELKEYPFTKTALAELWEQDNDAECVGFPNRQGVYEKYGGWTNLITLLRFPMGYGFSVMYFDGIYGSGEIDTLDDAIEELLKFLEENGGEYYGK